MNDDIGSEERKVWARTLYTQNGKTIAETAREVNASESQMREWIVAGEWDTVRRSLLLSKQMQLDRLYAMLESLDEKMKQDPGNVKDMALVLKYTTAIRNLDTENSVYATIEAAELFIGWLYRRDKALAQTFTNHFQVYIKERMAA
jgi:septum formation inhibitor MinC